MITLATDYANLTKPQLTLLKRLLADSGIYAGRIYGAGEVKAARKLEGLGLIKLTDDGLSPMGGNRDGERWSAEVIDRDFCSEIIRQVKDQAR